MTLRIHGDNIVECERTLKLIESAYGATSERANSAIYQPQYRIKQGENVLFCVDLLAGHDRWNVHIKDELAKHGAPLREATDAYITRLSDDGKTEEILLAIEFCSALPAGNNAWQRSGRAATCAEIGIPYLYFAEIGGVELDENRAVKSPRFPNPIVPFSYLAASKALDVVCVPVYEPHPAISAELREKYQDIFGLSASLPLIKGILQGYNYQTKLNILLEKGLNLVQLLADSRKRKDTFQGHEWISFLNCISGQEKAQWLSAAENKQIWRKKAGDKIAVSETFQQLVAAIQPLSFCAIGAKDMPICLIDKANLEDFTTILRTIYPESTIEELVSRVEHINKPLLVIWMAGFKPQGDDSRPDRGLVPLVRMLFGNDIKILTIVYGPAKENVWRLFQSQPLKLPHINGLWEAIFSLSDYILADSATSTVGALTHIVDRKLARKTEKVRFQAANTNIQYSEQDVDTAIHHLFSKQQEYGIFEGLCNPPGGDWSGISVLDYETNEIFRWTSLPRVSAIGGKRPDHLIQFLENDDIFALVIESKGRAQDLEENIGVHLTQYITDLWSNSPTAFREIGREWSLYTKKDLPIAPFPLISAGAFVFKNAEELSQALTFGQLDIVFAFEFKDADTPSVLHIKTSDKYSFLNDWCQFIAFGFVNLVVEIH